MYKDLKKSYTGGATDMYIPCNPPETKVFAYDVNSLFPTTMAEMKMPVTSKTRNYITYFEGDISLLDKEAFGFFHRKIETSRNLEHPILQIKLNTGRVQELFHH